MDGPKGVLSVKGARAGGGELRLWPNHMNGTAPSYNIGGGAAVSGAYAIRELNLAVSDEIFDRLWKGTLKDEPWSLSFVGPFGWLVKLWPARRTEWSGDRSLEWGKYKEQ